MAATLMLAAPSFADVAPDPEDVDAALLQCAREAGLNCDAVASSRAWTGADAAALQAQGLQPVEVVCRDGLRVLVAETRRRRWFPDEARPAPPRPVVRALNGPTAKTGG